MKCRIRFLGTILSMLIVFGPIWSQAEISESIESEALEILKSMNDYLLSQQAFGFRAIVIEEEVLDDGQKLMYSKEVQFKMVRPDRFHLQSNNGNTELEMFYGNSSFTIFRKNVNFFSTTKAPSTITEVFNHLEEKLNIQIIARDILRDNSSEFLLALMESGFVVGDALLHGVPCTHLAFRFKETDMQVWVTSGQQALPVKYVVTSRWITGAPQYSISFFDWLVQNDIDKEAFVFKAPKDAKEIPFQGVTPNKEVN